MDTIRFLVRARDQALGVCDAAVACVARHDARTSAPEMPERLDRELQREIRDGVFEAETGEIRVTTLPSKNPRYLVLAGLGKQGKPSFSVDLLKRAMGAAIRRIRKLKVRSAWFGWPASLPPGDAARAASEGILLGLYSFERKKKPSPPPAFHTAYFSLGTPSSSAPGLEAIRVGQALASAQCLARDLANAPANETTPLAVAGRAAEMARAKRIRCRVLGPRQLARLGCGALLGVGRGSRNPTQFLILEHGMSGKRRRPPLVFVGKGVTFDSGGISIKPASNMHHMKGDMSGAAAVIAALGACADLRVPYPVVGLVPLAENMPDGNAQRPGDIVKSISGLTIEVLNTDAEGRLILADAISYAHRYKPAAIIDIATLTGACAAALGDSAAGLFTEDAGLTALVRDASKKSGELTWPMPIWESLKKSMDSDIADLKNISEMPSAGATTAAVFLSKFAAPHRWAHLDMAGPMWANPDSLLPIKGATGYGAKLLAQIALDWTEKHRK